MYRWIVVLEDCSRENSSRIRKEHFSKHFAFLQANFHRIVFSCGLKDVQGQEETSYGGFWIVEADTKDEVTELFRQDPYFELGLRSTVSVFKAHEGYI